MQITRHERAEADGAFPFVVWRFDGTRTVLSTAVLGGGCGPRSWILNATVARGYDRPDPADHLAALAASAGLDGAGVGLMTAVDVDDLVARADQGVTAWATVGVEQPSWAAAASPSWHQGVPAPGTINIVVDVPVAMSPGALVNLATTATEAKGQALADHGLAGTGTPTDAVCVVCSPAGDPEPYGGPRSIWGARVARAVRDAVAAGLVAGGDRT